jgi:hypothetical protein
MQRCFFRYRTWRLVAKPTVEIDLCHRAPRVYASTPHEENGPSYGRSAMWKESPPEKGVPRRVLARLVDLQWTMLLIATMMERRLSRSKLVLLQILIGNIVLRNLMSVHFPRILIVGFFHSRHRARFKDVTFFNQLIDAFRIRLLGAGQSF